MGDEDTLREILALDAARAEALVRADVGFLAALTADDYTHVESTGTARDKRAFLDGLQSGLYRFESFVITENAVRLFGATAVVTGRYHNQIRTPAGLQPVKHARHLRVYVRRDGLWRNVAHQATEIREPASLPSSPTGS